MDQRGIADALNETGEGAAWELQGRRNGRFSRRRLLIAAGVGVAGGAALAVSPAGRTLYQRLYGGDATSIIRGATGVAAPGWTLSPANPILDIDPASPWTNLAVWDCSLLRQPDGSLLMWYSTRGDRPTSIALALDTTGTGDRFVPLPGDPILQPGPPETPPSNSINRPSVLRVGDGWRMWYSAVGDNTAWIGTATSLDGRVWTKHGSPVLRPSLPWELEAVYCPNVQYDPASGRYLMWYSAGQTYEPNAVGFATSSDGISWTRHGSDPIYTASTGWEDGQIGSFQVTGVGDWYYAFYNAFQRQPFTSRIGMARSRDGSTGWERHPDNPILAPGAPGTWNGAMIYKPAALWDDRRQRWDVWFNASAILNERERIGHMWRDGLW